MGCPEKRYLIRPSPMMTYMIVWSMTADSTFLPETIALVIVVHAFAVAAQVRIAPAVLVVLAAKLEAIRDALQIGDGARTAAVVIRIARVDADAEWRSSIDHSSMCADGENLQTEEQMVIHTRKSPSIDLPVRKRKSAYRQRRRQR